MLKAYEEGMLMDNKDFFYDALPYIYTIGGVLTLLMTGEMIGRASGVLLISAAMMVFHLRLQHRTERATKAEMRLTATQQVLAKTKREMLGT
jgi:uncharacterized phosphosugar-binding protein